MSSMIAGPALLPRRPSKIVVAFDPNDDELREVRTTCAKACAEYNTTDETASSLERGNKFKNILSRSALHHAAPTKVQTPFYMEYGLRVFIHETAFIDRDCKIVDTPVADIKIGKYASIGPNVSIVSAAPPPTRINIENLARGRRELTGEPVTIGNGAWIGASVVIGPGVTIGEGAMVSAGAVVLDNVPAYAEVRGNPAKVVDIGEARQVSEETEHSHTRPF
ncbi:trimeric LpxA-like protein [Annulohypoxylon bovei var. microspora]|nr:trimeric LpxA-like protein [Annulohypoxylon bovei var. microspora]